MKILNICTLTNTRVRGFTCYLHVLLNGLNMEEQNQTNNLAVFKYKMRSVLEMHDLPKSDLPLYLLFNTFPMGNFSYISLGHAIV